MQSEHLQQIMDYYIEDAQNHLAIIEQHLLKLQSTIEDPEIVSELFRAARCGIVGGANLLPISSFYINSIHKTGFCLVDCLKVIQQQGSIKIDQKLKDLLMQVFYRLKSLIEQLRQPSNLKDDQAKQVISEIEPIRAALIAHLHGLSHQSGAMHRQEVGITKCCNVSDMTLQESAHIASELDDDIASLEELESLFDELFLDSSCANVAPSSQDEL